MALAMMKRIDLGEADDDKRIRKEWAGLLAEHMAAWTNPLTGAQGMSRKELGHRLELIGVKVSQQAISTWLTANNAPRPSVQIAIAKVLSVPARSLFPLNPANREVAA